MTRLVTVIRDVSRDASVEIVGYVANVNWAVATYDSAFGYVSAHGAPLIDLLDPQPDEKIIDLGCGAGALAAEISARGADVLGIDASPDMIAKAKAQYPELSFTVDDAHDFTVAKRYDAV